jgi:hypothetical protein
MSLVEDKRRVATPLEFFEAVYMNPDLPLGTRLRAATEAAKYTHPRLTAIATYAVGDDFSAQLDRAIMASRGERPMKVIEAPREGSKPNGKSPEEDSRRIFAPRIRVFVLCLFGRRAVRFHQQFRSSGGGTPKARASARCDGASNALYSPHGTSKAHER